MLPPWEVDGTRPAAVSECSVTIPWPEMASSSRPGETVRQMLDYVCWIAQGIQTLGAHGGSELDAWRRRVGAAYRALVNPMIPGYGDPYPPDVPPAVSPGTWPDVAASDIPGMTIRHQLVVIHGLAEQSRAGVGVRARPELLADLEARIARARTELDHGPSRPLPEEAKTRPSPELMAQAQAEAKAIREHARRRTRQVRDLLKGQSGPGHRRKGEAAARKAQRPKAQPRPSRSGKGPARPAKGSGASRTRGKGGGKRGHG
jgi:hypothetical protein